jgi:TolA-binding protein
VVGAIAVASVAGAGAVAVSRPPHVETSAPVGLVASATPSATTSAHANASAEVEAVADMDAGSKPAVTASAKIAPRASAATVASAEAKDEGPEAEVKLVQRAQDALRASRPVEALALCNDHAKRFPNGMVTQECEVIAVEALVKTGRKDEARKRADRFKARFPGSASIRRLDVLLAD